jgi:hypothetical protein
MNIHTPIWQASVALTAPRPEPTPAETVAAYQAVLDRARSIVAARPFLKDCGVRDPNTFYHLTVDDRADVAVLTWMTVGGAVDRQRFPARLLGMAVDEVWAWQATQGERA